MRRRPPKSTRPETLFPYRTPFRSVADRPEPGRRLRRTARQREVTQWRALQRALATASSPRKRGSSPLERRALQRAFATASRSEEHTSELQSPMRISYAVFCLKKKQKDTKHNYITIITYAYSA